MKDGARLDRHRAAIKERLIDAAVAGITHLRGNRRELKKMPNELCEEVLTLLDKSTSGVSTVKGGALQSIVREMSVNEAQIVVDEILALPYQIEILPRDSKEEY